MRPVASPDLDPSDTGTWLFRETEAKTSLSYLGEFGPDDRPAPGPTPVAPVVPGRPSGPLVATPIGRHDPGRPWAPQQPPAPPAVPTGPYPASQGAGTTLRSLVIGAGVGLLVLALAAVFLWLRGSGGVTAAPAPSRISTAATASSVAVASPSTATSEASGPAAQASSALPDADPSHNDASNRLGWTFLIDGLGPAKLGAKAQTAVDLGLVVASNSACGFDPTALLGDTRVYVRGGKIDSVDIRSASFRSGKGVHVGMSVAELKSTYEDTLKDVEIMSAGQATPGFALLNKRQYILYVTDGAAVTRIVIGYRQPDGGILLPPPAC